jgi:hypothetical protein
VTLEYHQIFVCEFGIEVVVALSSYVVAKHFCLFVIVKHLKKQVVGKLCL